VRLTVATYGSEGDTRPFVAVCRGLVDAGHDVKLFAEQSSVHIARAHGIDVEALAGDIKATMPLDDPTQELSTRELIRTVRKGLRGVNDSIVAWMSAITAHARTADAILYAGFACPATQTIAQQLDKPAIGLWLQPTTPTREFGSSALPPWRLPGWLNQFSYRASPEAMIRRLYGKSSEAARGNLCGHARRAGNKRELICRAQKSRSEGAAWWFCRPNSALAQLSVADFQSNHLIPPTSRGGHTWSPNSSPDDPAHNPSKQHDHATAIHDASKRRSLR